MSLLAKIASLRQVNINAHAEIEALKLQLADGDRSTLSTHEHHRELRDKLNAEIKTLTEKHQREHDSRMCDNDEEEERVDKICSALGLDATDGFTHPETNEAILEGIKTLNATTAAWSAESIRWEANCDALTEEVKTLKLCVADRDEHADALKDEIKSLRHFFSAQRWSADAFALLVGEDALKDEIKTLSLSLADRNEEVKTLKDEVEKQTILANSYRDTTEEYYEEKKELRCKQKTQATIISGMAKKITELIDERDLAREHNLTLKLSLADRDEEVKTLKCEVETLKGVCMGCGKQTTTYIYNTHNGNTIPCCKECSTELGVPHKVAETEE